VRPLAQSDGHDPPGLIDELVPSLAAMVDEIVVGFEDAVGEPVVAHKLPDIFHRVEFGRFRRQCYYGDVGRHDETRRHVPASLIDQENGVSTMRHSVGDLREVQVHCLGVAGRQDQGRALAQLWTDRTEDVGGSGALITGRTWTGAALGPTPRDLVLLADPGLVLEPDFYVVAIDCLLVRDGIQARGEAFLKSSITPSTCA
jgi:hypothetical protein